MSFLKRLEKSISKMEKRIENEEEKVKKLEEKYNDKKITKAKFNIEKRKIQDKIKSLRARHQTLKGLVVKEIHHQEEKAEEKEKKKEEKLKKKGEK